MATVPVTWRIEVDWTGAGVWVNEAARVVSLLVERGSETRFEPPAAGKAVLTLENQDRRFDPWFTSGPLYPNVQPHRPLRIVASYAGTDYPLFRGRVEEFEPTGMIGQRRVTVTAYDGLRELGDSEAAVSLRAGITRDQAINLLLDDAGWPGGASYRDLDASADVMAWWWRDSEQEPKADITALVLSEHGAFFMTAEGKARFIGRVGFTTGDAVTTLDEDHLTDVALVNPWEAVVNDVKVTCRPITLEGLDEVWKLVDTNVYLAPNETAEVWAEYTDSRGSRCAATGVVTPAATTDYTANSATDGTGTDLTASLGVTLNAYATWAKLTLRNNGTTGLYVTLCRLRGQALAQNGTTVRAQDAGSQGSYGRRQLEIDTPWQQRVAAAKDLAQGLVNNFKTPAPPATVELRNRLPTMLDFELFDRVTLALPTYGLNRTMQVGSIALRTGQTMQELTLTLGLLPAETQTAWMLGIAGKGELGQTTWLGY